MPDTTPSDSTSPADDEPMETDEQVDTEPEDLPSASDGPAPTVSVSRCRSHRPSRRPRPRRPARRHSQPAVNRRAVPRLARRGRQGRSVRGQSASHPDQAFLADLATTDPVFVDPSFKKHVQSWTTAYSRHPNATFYNGKGFKQGGTHEARVGFESDTWGTSRSVLQHRVRQGPQGHEVLRARS